MGLCGFHLLHQTLDPGHKGRGLVLQRGAAWPWCHFTVAYTAQFLVAVLLVMFNLAYNETCESFRMYFLFYRLSEVALAARSSEEKQ